MKTKLTRVAIVSLLLLSGCSPAFKDEAEEVEYLSALDQPTLEQFRRRKELMQKAQAERDAFARQIKAAGDAADKVFRAQMIAEEKIKQERLKVERAAEAKKALKEAKVFEDRFFPGVRTAGYRYRELIRNYPESPEAETAKERIKAIEEAVDRRKQEGK